jgi:hypothetical protein
MRAPEQRPGFVDTVAWPQGAPDDAARSATVLV